MIGAINRIKNALYAALCVYQNTDTTGVFGLAVAACTVGHAHAAIRIRQKRILKPVFLSEGRIVSY
jgi:hypothetical protein